MQLRLRLGRGKLGPVQAAIAIGIRALELVRGPHRPFLESQQVIPIDIKLAKRGNPRRERLDPGHLAIAVAIKPIEAALLLGLLGRLRQRRTMCSAQVSIGQRHVADRPTKR
jgi:hypothetical protein